MNYRHAYHAGNHADVLKHAVLARLVEYLAAKDKPFAVLDAHAGIGAYDLLGPEASKTDEWRGGVGLMRDRFGADVEAVLTPYRKAVAALNADGGVRYYPGSPDIILQGLRAHDRLIANELHPQDAETLRMNYAGERRLHISVADAWQAVKAHLPFHERRGLVLIDPSYEGADESERVVRMLEQGSKRFATGIFMIWYPVTTEKFVSDLLAAIANLGIGNILEAELRIKNTHEASGLSGSGLLILNPPFTLQGELQILLPALAQRLGIQGLGRAQVSWLTPAKG
ncbi:MAG: 23S rRNA (adenine(2030)-N(6))-methyltransferase RlmJ [Aestuariivirga sp.]